MPFSSDCLCNSEPADEQGKKLGNDKPAVKDMDRT